jgi:hypothetical protein
MGLFSIGGPGRWIRRAAERQSRHLRCCVQTCCSAMHAAVDGHGVMDHPVRPCHATPRHATVYWSMSKDVDGVTELPRDGCCASVLEPGSAAGSPPSRVARPHLLLQHKQCTVRTDARLDPAVSRGFQSASKVNLLLCSLRHAKKKVIGLQLR